MQDDVSGLRQGKCFPFLRIASRPDKPRERGLTVIADRGMGPARQQDLLAVGGEFIDVAKFAMGLPRILSEELIRKKIAMYAEHDIPVFFAGELSELAVLQDIAGDYYKAIKTLGGWGVEISNAQIAMGPAEKAALIVLAQKAGLSVVAECGRKGGVSWADSAKLVGSEIKTLLEAGAWRVLIQAEGLNEGVEQVNERLIQDVVAEFGLDRLIFQAKEAHLIGWFLTTFGAAVNLDIDDGQILDLESQRRGMRKRNVFGLMASI